ncbi:MAG TPA: response regulator [Opitutaceae bacterium]|nr:response regulator [Opitutaceae bacterium]
MPDLDQTFCCGRKVVVIDDDPAVREMLVRVLVDAGFEAFAAASGREALALLNSHHINVVLLDLGMPGENGWVTLANLRQCRPALRAIIITAWPDQRQAAAAAGAVGCFEKPLDFPELLAAVARAAELSGAGGNNGFPRPAESGAARGTAA